MKRISYLSLILLSLGLIACSNQNESQSIEDSSSISQTSIDSSSSSSQTTIQSNVRKTGDDLAPNGQKYKDLFLKSFKEQILSVDPNNEVLISDKQILIKLNIILSDEQIPKSQNLADNIYKIKTEGEKVYRENGIDYSVPQLFIIDAQNNIIAIEKDGKMVLEK
ncbi:hypothetical protein [Streptococcus parasanguinis]|nr:hypothetical protein [Streptococcus parasanguinis]MBS6987351.1 hypothetical protein [Streptococcus parasanguinis]